MGDAEAPRPALAPPTVRWTARLVDADRVPRRWGEFASDDVLRLKDTRHAFWRNELVAPNRFVYLFPTAPTRAWEAPLVGRIRKRVATRRPLRVELYAAPGSRNESYGDWVVTGMRPRLGQANVSELTLVRLAAQPDAPPPAALPAYRSRNEGAHAALLARAFPPDRWLVAHEPETLLDLHEPTVVDGVAARAAADDPTRSYTCDFVVAARAGCARLCVESKPCEAHVTPAALAKCRLLRDRTLTRVVIACGAGAADARWCDLGPPRSEAPPAWHETTAALLAALGLPG
jgi:hypothetical protein